MKRVVVAVVAVVLVAGLAGLGSTANAADQAVAAPTAFTPTLSGWTGCGPEGLQCSRLTVPLDYANPDDGRTVQLAITMLAAEPFAGAYAGMMVTNPGGPGGSGTQLAYLRDDVPGTAAGRYDWFGMDPRGVGASTPSLHCNTTYFGPNRPTFNPTTSRLLHFWLRKTSGYAAACGRSAAKSLLPFMTTRDSARDLESLRTAYLDSQPALSAKRAQLQKLNYYGYSYGTYLGVVYATAFPTRVGRFVLDGVVDPDRYWYRSNFDQSVAFDRNLNLFFAWMARNNRSYHLGTSGRKIRAGYNTLLKKLDRHPKAGGRLGPDELADALLPAAYYVFDWNSIGSAYAALVRHGSGAGLYSMYASANRGTEADNGYAVYNAVQCTDQRRPPLKQQLSDTRKVARRAPFLAWDNTWFNMPCLTWPAPARGRGTVSGAGLAALGTKILLINETRDAATPYSGALNVRQLFPTASLIAGVGGTTHAGSLHGNVACVDDRVASYLATGAVPPRQAGRRSDVGCPAIRPPSAYGYRTSGRATAARGTSLWLRDDLVAAQRASLH